MIYDSVPRYRARWYAKLVALCLVRGESLDAQSVNVGLHQRSQRVIDQAVPCQRSLALEGLGNNSNVIVAKSIDGTGMAGMQVALILD